MGRLTKEEIKKIAPNYRVAVETGLWKGEQLEVIAKCFDKTFGIELDAHYAEVSRKRVPSATVYCGDTAKLLPIVSQEMKEPSVFFLDAHYCKLEPPIAKSEFPLWDELKTINARNLPDIVIVDDVHTFGKKRDDLLFKEGDKEWEHVTPGNILEYFPQAKRSEIYKDSFIVWL
jgi:tRNA U34 5-methylaminomethyl-2-thiouridine-forming methyltransferase MnmC